VRNSGEPLSHSCCISQNLHSAVHDVVKKLPILRILHDHEDCVGGFYDFVQLSDGRVADQFEDVEFAGDSFDIGDVFDFVFLQDFDGHGFEGVIMDGLFDFAECALADGRPC